jgi:hypothetical protein
MEWVYVYLTLVKNVPVLSVGKENYETEQECHLAHAGRGENPFWCVPRNWLDEGATTGGASIRDRLAGWCEVDRLRASSQSTPREAVSH